MKINLTIFSLILICQTILASQIYSRELRRNPTQRRVAVSCLSQNRGFYTGWLVGPNWMQPKKSKFSSPDMGYALASSLGYRFWWPIRIEGEFSYNSNKSKDKILKEDIKNYIGMANFCFDFESCSFLGFYPSLGVGVGYNYTVAKTKYELVKLLFNQEMRKEFKKGFFAYQAIVGVSRGIFNKMEIGIEYRFIRDKYTGDQVAAFTLRRFF